MLLPSSWKSLDCEMLSLPDTLWELLAGFASMAWSTASESTDLDIPDLSWLLRFLQAK